MTDTRLLFVKHGRIFLPLTACLVVLDVIRVLSDELVVQQIYGIGTMLLFVTLTVYSLDAVIRLIGLGEDRLLLLSPWPRWRLCVVNVVVLGAFLVAVQLIGQIPSLVHAQQSFGTCIGALTAYLISIISGFGLMAMLVYALKKTCSSKFRLLIFVWVSYVLTLLIVSAVLIKTIDVFDPGLQWLLGVTAQNDATNLFAAILPITFFGKTMGWAVSAIEMVANLCFGLVCWITARFLSSRKTNFLQLR